ncbi:hypothetical protein M2281_003605 [Mesorhizobium soli]|uniref:hypothetical protein n=1 Tax=Pseudaminobacter soli (ex Li et al. 2025) TaxID=1295366 RepID=UPI002475842F|nr:hypothetical protein [Mesorhizobium soli]MDH6232994.1 hypothetical protein [Mesorhizobium soli]
MPAIAAQIVVTPQLVHERWRDHDLRLVTRDVWFRAEGKFAAMAHAPRISARQPWGRVWTVRFLLSVS